MQGAAPGGSPVPGVGLHQARPPVRHADQRLPGAGSLPPGRVHRTPQPHLPGRRHDARA
jgi:hypothetical protein